MIEFAGEHERNVTGTVDRTGKRKHRLFLPYDSRFPQRLGAPSYRAYPRTAGVQSSCRVLRTTEDSGLIIQHITLAAL
jgi:hypothetical protein